MELLGHTAAVSAFAWAPGDARTLVGGDADGTVLWRVPSVTRPGEQLRPGGLRHTDPVSAITIGARTVSVAATQGGSTPLICPEFRAKRARSAGNVTKRERLSLTLTNHIEVIIRFI